MELCTWFVHDDIVWVTNDDGNYTVGRVVETSRRVFERQLPLDDVMRERPADSTNFTLVNLFSSSGKQWSVMKMKDEDDGF